MAVVNRIALKYAVKGAKAAQRADRNVRETVRKTGRVARRQSRDIKAWLRENKRQIAAIAGALASAVGVFLSKSPAMQIASSRLRFQLSLLAFEIGQKLKPAMDNLADGVEDVVTEFRNLDDDAQNLILTLSPLIGIATAVGLALAGVSSTAALVTAFVGGTIAAFVTLTKAAQENKRIIGLAAVVLGTIAAVIAFGPASVVAAVGAALVVLGSLVTMFDEDIAGAVETAWNWLKDFASTIKETVVGAVEDLGDALNLSSAVSSMKSTFRDGINKVIGWVNDLIEAWNAVAEDVPWMDTVDKIGQVADETRRAAGKAQAAAENFSQMADEAGNVPGLPPGVLGPADPVNLPIRGSGDISMRDLRDAVKEVEGFIHPALDLNEIRAFLRRSIRFERSPEELSRAASGTAGVGGTLGDPRDIVDIINQVSGLHFQHGGVVPGQPGQPVPAVLHGGEVVLSRDQVQALASQQGGGGGGGGGGGDTTIINNNVHEGAVQVHDSQDGGREAADDLIRRFRSR